MQIVVNFFQELEKELYARCKPNKIIRDEKKNDVKFIYYRDSILIPCEWEIYNPVYLIKIHEKGSKLSDKSGRSSIICSKLGNEITPIFITTNPKLEYQAVFLVRECILINYKFYSGTNKLLIHELEIDEIIGPTTQVSITKSLLYDSSYSEIPDKIKETFNIPIQLAIKKAKTRQKKCYFYKGK